MTIDLGVVHKKRHAIYKQFLTPSSQSHTLNFLDLITALGP
jgi:hypothetical protein